MTLEKYDKATEIQKKIQYLGGLVKMLEYHKGNESPFSMTDFYIKDNEGPINLLNFEIPILLQALRIEINDLKIEFERL